MFAVISPPNKWHGYVPSGRRTVSVFPRRNTKVHGKQRFILPQKTLSEVLQHRIRS